MYKEDIDLVALAQENAFENYVESLPPSLIDLYQSLNQKGKAELDEIINKKIVELSFPQKLCSLEYELNTREEFDAFYKSLWNTGASISFNQNKGVTSGN